MTFRQIIRLDAIICEMFGRLLLLSLRVGIIIFILRRGFRMHDVIRQLWLGISWLGYTYVREPATGHSTLASSYFLSLRHRYGWRR